jgi:NADP-dependent 3-hydroxy acid dehydrogenase YdfG
MMTRNTVLVTGAAKGIGRSTVLLFQKKGWNVAAAMKTLDQGTAFKGLANVKCYILDVRDTHSIKQWIKTVIEDFKHIDVLVNNAGIYTTCPLEAVEDEMVEQIFKVNIQGTIRVTREILPHFRERRKGTIINVSSIAGKITFPFQSLYHSTKWAIEGFSRGLAHELKAFNIRVTTVAPGMVKTNLYDGVRNLEENRYPMAYRTNFTNWYRFLMKNFQKGYGPEVPAKTIYRAAGVRCFKPNYASGMDTKLAFFFNKILPGCAFNAIIRKSVGI